MTDYDDVEEGEDYKKLEAELEKTREVQLRMMSTSLDDYNKDNGTDFTIQDVQDNSTKKLNDSLNRGEVSPLVFIKGTLDQLKPVQTKVRQEPNETDINLGDVGAEVGVGIENNKYDDNVRDFMDRNRNEVF